MLAYSSIANAGYILVAIVTGTQTAFAALLVYLIGYAVMNIGAFGVVLALEKDDGMGTSLPDFAGLARRRRGLAATMAVFLFSLAGIPPLVGFAAKYYVFNAAFLGGHLELDIIGVISSLIGMFYYLRVIWFMYFIEPQPSGAGVTVAAGEPPSEAPPPPAVPVGARQVATSGSVALAESPAAAPAGTESRPATPSRDIRSTTASSASPRPPRVITPGTWLALAISLILTVALGILPEGIFNLATQAASALFH
jgi:NADH-quinone oxidoreductase subunit N